MSTQSSESWHERFLQQVRWTANLRQHLWQQMDIVPGMRILEVGAGTGAVLDEVYRETHCHIYGIDINFNHLQVAKTHIHSAGIIQGDGLSLPILSGSFDLVFCHYYLLWVSDPAAALREMVRVTCNGGFVAALAEPDYGGRIDHPPALMEIGRLQEIALQKQGADTILGRRLKGLFHQSGLSSVHVGLLGGEWNAPPSSQEWESEWDMLRHDLQDSIDPATLRQYRNLDAIAWQTQERILFVPTFYAWGRVDK